MALDEKATEAEVLEHKARALDLIIAALNDDANESNTERLSAVESILLYQGFDITY